jgi:hypothetical protein
VSAAWPFIQALCAIYSFISTHDEQGETNDLDILERFRSRHCICQSEMELVYNSGLNRLGVEIEYQCAGLTFVIFTPDIIPQDSLNHKKDA